MANDAEYLALVRFSEQFGCYLEGPAFEIIADTQVLKCSFKNPKLSRRGRKCLETLVNFGIFPIILNPGKIHILEMDLKCTECGRSFVIDIEIPYTCIDNVISRYDDDE